MATYTTTTKHALRWLTGTNVISDIDAGFQTLAEDLDALIAIADKGIESARPTSTSGSPGKTGRFYYATDTGRLFFDHGTGWLDIITRPGVVTSLPASNLYDGQIVHFQTAAMALAGVVWQFRYRPASSSAYKWEFIGGGAYTVKYTGAYTVFGSGSVPIDLSTPITFTTTLAGEYEVEYSAQLAPASGVASQEGIVLPMATEAYDEADAIHSIWTSVINPGSLPQPLRHAKVCTGIAAGTIRLQGMAPGSPNWTATKLRWSIQPIRVA